MKKSLLLAALTLSGFNAAWAQALVDSDTEFTNMWNFNYLYAEGGLTIDNATVTISSFSLNIVALPQAVSLTNLYEPVTLTNGAAVKFFDCPQYAYPTEDTFAELDQEHADANGYSWDLISENYTTQLNFDWIVEGKGNAIYLDSYCTFSGTVTGGSAENPAELTIYCTNKSQIGTVFGNALNEANPAFYGTVYLKTLEGYSTDTIFFTDAFRPGNANIGAGDTPYLGTKSYSTSSTMFDITGAGNPVLFMDYANTVVPPVIGEGTIFAQRFPYVNGWCGGDCVYDCVINGGTEYTGYDFEMYGGNLVFNKPVNYVATGKYAYCRSEAAIYVNSQEPCFSNVENGISQRGKGFTGGTGYWDCNYSPNSGRVNTLSSGYPYWEVGQMTWKNVWVYSGNVVRFDFNNEGHSDIINIAQGGKYNMYEGQNDVYIGLPEGYAPKAGNYKVINGEINASLATYNDTIGYEVWDNNGCAYVIRSVKGGEVIALADGSNNNYVAQPGDSIGSATFGQLAGLGATCMDGNRPHYVIANWGAGTFSNNEPTDGSYKNVDSPSLYTANPDQMGTAFSDSAKWQAAWDKFCEENPVSNAWEAVSTNDGSVIPGTVGDSIFLTYSKVRDADHPDGAGAHAWSYKNGSGYECTTKGYPYAAAIHFAYYYYPNNTVRMQGCSGSNYINGEDTLKVGLSSQVFPIALTENDTTFQQNADDPAKMDTIVTTRTVGQRYYTAWSANAPAADGDSVSFRFNFKHYLTDGVISVETRTIKANATEPVYETPGEDTEKGGIGDNVINAGDLTSMGTLAKEVHAVGARAYYTLDGRRMKSLVPGINIVKTTYTDGTFETKRVIVR